MRAVTSEETAPAAVHRASLDRSLVQGLAWTGAAKWSSQLLTWVATLVVARVLTPADYGLVSMASIYLGLVALMNEFGLGAAIVTLRDLTEDQVAQINTAVLMFGAAAFAVSCAMAVPLGSFFRAPELPWVVVVMSTTFVITALRVVPYALLEKGLRFRFLALMDSGQALVVALGTVVLALAGLGYWTLVLGGVAGALVATCVTMVMCPQRFAWPRWRSLGGALRFSQHIVVSRLCWYVYSHADSLVAGRLLGQSALGAYALGSSLASVPVDKVSGLVMRVTPALFAAVQTERSSLRRYLLALSEGLALITFPAALGLALVADDFVLLALGEKWREVIPALRLLAAYATFRSIVTLLPPVLNVTGDSRFGMRNGLLAAALLPVAFYVGSGWGIVGIAAAWVLVHPLVSAPLYWRVFRRIELSVVSYLRALWPALSASCAMAAAVWAVKESLLPAGPLGWRLAAEVAVGAVSYVAIIGLLHRRRLSVLAGVVKMLRGTK